MVTPNIGNYFKYKNKRPFYSTVVAAYLLVIIIINKLQQALNILA